MHLRMIDQLLATCITFDGKKLLCGELYYYFEYVPSPISICLIKPFPSPDTREFVIGIIPIKQFYVCVSGMLM